MLGEQSSDNGLREGATESGAIMETRSFTSRSLCLAAALERQRAKRGAIEPRSSESQPVWC